MRTILKSMRLDYYTLKSNNRILFIIYAIVIFLGVMTASAVTIGIVMIFAAVLSGRVFSVAEKNNLGKLYGSLPIARFEVVAGRFLYALLFGIINLVIAGVLAAVASFFAGKGIDYLTFITYLSGSFLYYCLAIGIQFPVYFKFGFSKAYIFTMVPLYIVFMIAIFISKSESAINSLAQMIQYFTANPAMIWVAGIGLGLVLLCISLPISNAIYKKSGL